MILIACVAGLNGDSYSYVVHFVCRRRLTPAASGLPYCSLLQPRADSATNGPALLEVKTRNEILSTLRAAARPVSGCWGTNGQDFITHDRR